MSDDLNSYAAERDTAHLSASEVLLQRVAAKNAALEKDKQPAAPTINDELAKTPTVEELGKEQDQPEQDGRSGSVSSDIGRGLLSEAPKQILGGIGDAVNETLDMTKDMSDWLDTHVANLGGEPGESKIRLPEVDQPATKTGGIVRSVSQFLAGFAGAGEILKPIEVIGTGAKAVKAMAQGVISDAAAFDPHQERLSNLVQKYPQLQNPVSDFLQAKPDDSDAEGRFKNAVEGLGLGAATEGLFKGVKILRSAGIAKREAKKLLDAKETASKITEVAKPPTIAEDVEKNLGGDAPQVEIKKEEPAETPELSDSQAKDLTPEQIENIEQAKADPSSKYAVNINMNRIDTTEDIDAVIRKTGEAMKGEIDEARRGKITHEETEKLANDLGMTSEALLQRRRGQAFNAEEAVAARKVLVSSGDNVVRLAAKAEAGGEADVLAFMNAMSKHTAIQKQVSGMAAEAGRALSSFNIKVGESNANLIDAISSVGGVGRVKKAAAAISTAENAHQLNRMIRETASAKFKDMALEVWINGLLSNPVTHTANMLSNSITNVWMIPERFLASKIGEAFGDREIKEEEALVNAYGMVQGMKDGLNLAWKSLKSGEASDLVGKVETQSHAAISAEAFNQSGMFGQAVDMLGHLVRSPRLGWKLIDFAGHTARVPGRLLTASDEFFKAVAYRGELHAQVFRQAKAEGLTGDELASRIGELMQDTPENIKADAMDARSYQTFTHPLGDVGQKIQSLSNSHPAMKVLMTFVKTPINIMKFVGERTPLAVISKNIRADIAAGGARRDVALARISMGSMLMMTVSDFAMSGDITGQGPTNYDMKRIWRDAGNQPYSIKIGDEWISYSRLDPIGDLIGLSADMSELLPRISDADALDIAAAVALSIAQNTAGKTFTTSVTKFVNAFTAAKADPNNKNAAWKRYIQNLAASAVPSGVAAAARLNDGTMRQADGVIDAIKRRTPGYSKDLPPVRNMWGEPIMYSGALGPDFISPIYTSKIKSDPVDEMLIKNDIPVKMPQRKIRGVDLKPFEYDRYVQLAAGKGLHGVKRTLKQEIKYQMGKSSFKKATGGQDGGKALYISAITRGYNHGAQAQMLKEFPALKHAIIVHTQEKEQLIRGY